MKALIIETIEFYSPVLDLTITFGGLKVVDIPTIISEPGSIMRKITEEVKRIKERDR